MLESAEVSRCRRLGLLPPYLPTRTRHRCAGRVHRRRWAVDIACGSLGLGLRDRAHNSGAHSPLARKFAYGARAAAGKASEAVEDTDGKDMRARASKHENTRIPQACRAPADGRGEDWQERSMRFCAACDWHSTLGPRHLAFAPSRPAGSESRGELPAS